MKKRFDILSIERKWFEPYLSNGEQQCSINERTIIQEPNHLRRPLGLNLGSIIVFIIY